jgi:putative ABC transport system substrate-binding protein
MRRRDFITLLGAAAAAWPVAARAQQTAARRRRIGALTHYSDDDPAGATNIVAFVQKLGDLGWAEGRNVSIELRRAAASSARFSQYAAELVAMQPDVLLASTGPALDALLQATRTIPIVFTSVIDPVGSGFVESLARPGGNATGFTNIEWGVSGKWPDLLKQIVPRTTRVAVIRDPSVLSGSGQLGAIQAAAASLGLELRPIDSRDAPGIERAIASFAQQPNGAVIETLSGTGVLNRHTTIAAAARYRLPAIYPARYYVSEDGGLMSYGPEQVEMWRLAAGYVDRVLKGEKPADLPVQAPTKYELVINLKTAKALGLTVPQTLLVAADEVIE